MTIRLCDRLCLPYSGAFPFFGILKGRDCFCGSSLPELLDATGQCTYPNAGAPSGSEIGGSDTAVSVFTYDASDGPGDVRENAPTPVDVPPTVPSVIDVTIPGTGSSIGGESGGATAPNSIGLGTVGDLSEPNPATYLGCFAAIVNYYSSLTSLDKVFSSRNKRFSRA